MRIYSSGKEVYNGDISIKYTFAGCETIINNIDEISWNRRRIYFKQTNERETNMLLEDLKYVKFCRGNYGDWEKLKLPIKEKLKLNKNIWRLIW